MGTVARAVTVALGCLIYLSLVVTPSEAQRIGDAELVYEWSSLEFEWPSEKHLNEALANRTYIPERNLVAGIKIYRDSTYVTIPRWFWTSGHPVTLAKVVNVKGEVKLEPYPTWAAQTQGDCNCLQYVQGMEIDPNTGRMYVVDTGRIADTDNLCPAKIVVYDLNSISQVEKYELPPDVASPTSNFLNDIVLDYIGGKVRFAYITDANDKRLLVFDFQTRTAKTVKHSSMDIESPQARQITINSKTYDFPIGIDGIAMSPDFKYVYYCSLAGFNLYQIPTSSLRHGKSDGIRLLGAKNSQSGGIGYGNRYLYYGALGLNAVYYWNSDKDMNTQKVGMDKVTLETEEQLVRNDSSMQWPDTLAFDTRGWIWFVSNRMQEFRELKGLPDGGDPYMRVWKVYANETGYLYQAAKRTEGTALEPDGGGSSSLFPGTCTTVLIHMVMFVCSVLILPEIMLS